MLLYKLLTYIINNHIVILLNSWDTPKIVLGHPVLKGVNIAGLNLIDNCYIITLQYLVKVLIYRNLKYYKVCTNVQQIRTGSNHS